MMDSFFISKIEVHGEGKVPSSLDFSEGVNIIYGPSNTGKSYVLSCIDFAFGSDVSREGLPLADNLGFDSVTMVIRSSLGGEITIQRNMYKDVTNANITSSVEGIESGDYNIKNNEFSNLLLKLIGINGPHILFTNKDKSGQQKLSWRTFLHMFFLQEDHIIWKKPIWDNPKHPQSTVCLSALLFLIKEYECTVDEKEEKTEVKEAKKKAVVAYINKQVERISSQLIETQNAIADKRDEDIESVIDDMVIEITNTENQILEASSKNKVIIKQILDIEKRAEEAKTLYNRYNSLAGQYKADLERLELIITGKKLFKEFDNPDHCPFCHHKLEEEKLGEFKGDADGEKRRIKLLLNDLQETLVDIQSEITDLSRESESLKAEQTKITELINKELEPKAKQLHQGLSSYRQAVELETKLGTMRTMLQGYSQDVDQKESEEDTGTDYNPKEMFTAEELKTLDDYISTAIRQCSYPDFGSAIISRSSFDVVVNGTKKQDQGKGYRAFLNSIYAFALQKFLYHHGMHSPRMLILDSPILSLNEKKKIKETDRVPEGMRSGLFKYLINNQDLRQIIIVENEIPHIDYSGVNLIEFTKSNEGRYGFLNGVK